MTRNSIEQGSSSRRSRNSSGRVYLDDVDLRAVKKEKLNRTRIEQEEADFVAVKKEKLNKNRIEDEGEALRSAKREKLNRSQVEEENAEPVHSTQQGTTSERRVLRSRYLDVKNLICDERDDMSRVDSDKFSSIFNKVENLHRLVQKPREQVADAEALLDIANTLVSSVKSQSNDGLSPSDFVNCLLKHFGGLIGSRTTSDSAQNSICWKDVGLSVSHVFQKVQGCTTMLGPMSTEIKQRKVINRGKRIKPTESAKPEELNSAEEERTDTDKNMSTMFDILRQKKRVKLECLILNRNSFAQTVENLFALSFLVKDGRAEIIVDKNGFHFVLPRNAPAAERVQSGNATYGHFVFRFDFKDWKLIMNLVPLGEELMPHREHTDDLASYPVDPVVESQEDPVEASQAPCNATPIKKFTRNRGLVIQEKSVVEDSPDSDDDVTTRAAAIRKCKRKLN